MVMHSLVIIIKVASDVCSSHQRNGTMLRASNDAFSAGKMPFIVIIERLIIVLFVAIHNAFHYLDHAYG